MCVNSLGMHSQKPIPVLEAFDGLKPLQRHRLVNGLFTAEAGDTKVTEVRGLEESLDLYI